MAKRQGPEMAVGQTPEGQYAAETPRTAAPSRRIAGGRYGYWLGDTERRYGRLVPSYLIPDHTKVEMLRDPVVAMGLGFISATLVRARRVIECVDERKQRFFEAMFRSFEQEFILQASMAVAMGSCGLIKRFEFKVPEPVEIDADPVWSSIAVPYILTGFDQCYPPTSSPRFDKKRREFKGMEVEGENVDVFYSLWLTLGQHRAFGAYEGQGRLENAYYHWWIKKFGWDNFLVYLQRNASPPVGVDHPPGKDAQSGSSHSDIAIAVGDSLRSGSTVALPSNVYETVDQMSAGTERLSSVRKWAIRFIESQSKIEDFHDIEDQCDRRILMGLLLPYQAVMEVTGGDLGGPTSSDKLTELAEQLLMMDAADIDRHINDYCFPAVDRFNFPAGSPPVRVRTVGLEADSRGWMFEALKILLNRPEVNPLVFDVPEAMERLNLPVTEDEPTAPATPAPQDDTGASGDDVGPRSAADRDDDDQPDPNVLERMTRATLTPPADDDRVISDADVRRAVRKLRRDIPEIFDEE